MSFCDGCGEQLTAPPPIKCARCGRHHWRNAKPGAAGLVVRDGTLLLVRRAHVPWRGAWCAPSGFCDGDEHPIVTAEREILEESGVQARVVGFLGIWTGDYGGSAADDDHEFISVAYYHAEPVDSGDGTADGVETDAVRWFAFDDLPTADQLAPPGTFPKVLEAWRAAYRAEQISDPASRPPVGPGGRRSERRYALDASAGS